MSWDDPRRVDLYDRALAQVDPAAKLRRRIGLSALESVQLFSGFRGTGKSTELRRLAHLMRESGAVVVLADMREFLNLELPLDISGFLITLAGAFSEGLGDDALLGWDPIKEGYWTRFKNFVTRTQIDFAGLDTSAAGLKTNLRDDPSFRARVQQELDGRVSALLRDVREFFAGCVEALRRKLGDEVQIVFILDSIEHLSVTAQSHHALAGALERVFTLHADKLRFENMHLIYTVPPWLKIRSPGVASLYNGAYLVPCVKVRTKQGEVFQLGVDTLVRVIAAREPEWERLLGRPALERLVLASGGYIRDLFRLLQEAVVLAEEQLPLTAERVELAIDEIRNSYSLTHQDAIWLARVARTHESELRDDTGLPDLSRYFDTHLLLCYRNGDEWYDIHPLIADRVAQIVARERDDGPS